MPTRVGQRPGISSVTTVTAVENESPAHSQVATAITGTAAPLPKGSGGNALTTPGQGDSPIQARLANLSNPLALQRPPRPVKDVPTEPPAGYVGSTAPHRVRIPTIDASSIPPADVTMFVYLDGDNNLARCAFDDINEMKARGSIPGRLNLFALVDMDSRFKTPVVGQNQARLLYFEKDAVKDRGILRELEITPDSKLGKMLEQSKGEPNMGDPELLRASIEYVKEKVPSQRFVLDVWNHGGGWMGAAWDDRPGLEHPEEAAEPNAEEDPTDHISAARYELHQALDGLGVDILSFDACLMASKEIAQVAMDVDAKYLVASEELAPGTGWNYTRVLQELETLFSSQEKPGTDAIAQAMVRAYGGSKERATLSSLRVADFPTIQACTDALAECLIKAGGPDNPHVVECYNKALRFGGGRWWNDTLDLGDFARKLSAVFNDGDIKPAAEALLAAITSACVTQTGSPDKDDPYRAATGISAYAPTLGMDTEYTNEWAAWRDTAWTRFIQKMSPPPDANADAAAGEEKARSRQRVMRH